MLNFQKVEACPNIVRDGHYTIEKTKGTPDKNGGTTWHYMAWFNPAQGYHHARRIPSGHDLHSCKQAADSHHRRYRK